LFTESKKIIKLTIVVYRVSHAIGKDYISNLI